MGRDIEMTDVERLETYKALARTLVDYENRSATEKEIEIMAKEMIAEDNRADSDFMRRY